MTPHCVTESHSVVDDGVRVGRGVKVEVGGGGVVGTRVTVGVDGTGVFVGGPLVDEGPASVGTRERVGGTLDVADAFRLGDGDVVYVAVGVRDRVGVNVGVLVGGVEETSAINAIVESEEMVACSTLMRTRSYRSTRRLNTPIATRPSVAVSKTISRENDLFLIVQQPIAGALARF